MEKFLKKINPYRLIRDRLVVRFQFQPYFIIAVWLYFLFIWLPANTEAMYYLGIIFLALIPFVLPFLLIKLAWHGWLEYHWQLRYSETEYVLLEIKLPEEITQTPYAAELMLRGLYQTGEVDTPIQGILGYTKPWFSLEIASLGGRVHFYMWGRRRYKELMENQIYAHYPTVQVVEVPDYTLQVPFDPNVVTVWGIEQRLQKPDPYPILTYVELGVDKRPDLKEEFKHDPLASVIEFLGSLKPEEHVWIQFIIRAHGPKDNPTGSPYFAEDHPEEAEKVDIEEWSKEEIHKVIEESGASEKDEGKKKPVNFNALSEGDKQAITSIQNKLNKQLYDVGIRAVYIAPKEISRGAPRAGIPSTFRSFEHGSEGRGLNGIRPVFWIGPFNYWYQDFMNIRRHMLWRRFYDAYVTRQFFYPPHKHRWIVLNSEEIATMYHFPGQVVRTPTLQRLPSRRGEAPANLPI